MSNSVATNNNTNPTTASEKGRQIPIVCPGHTRPLAELEFCYVKDEDRTLLVSACHDKMPMMRDGTTGDWIGTFAGHKGAVWSCRLDPSGSLAATASGDFSVKVWDAITGNSLWHFTQHKHIVKTCDFSPNSTKLATGGHEGILRIYDLQHPKKYPLEIQPSTTSTQQQQQQSSKVKSPITKCNWWTDDIVLVAYANGTIRFWKLLLDSSTSSGDTTTTTTNNNNDDDDDAAAPTAAECIHELYTSTGPEENATTATTTAEIRDMELSYLEDSQMYILTVAAGDYVFFWNVEEKTLLHRYKMPIHFREEGGASIHPSGTKFVAGGSDLWVRVFDFASGQELECHKGHHGPIRCVRYSPNGTIYASGSEDGTIRLWKTDP